MTVGSARWVGWLVVMAVAVASGPVRTGASRRPPNLLLILTDDHRWDGLGVAGNPHVHTPNLDRFARESLYFRQGTIDVPQCSPARAMLLTGLPPHRSGWLSNQYQRPDHLLRPPLTIPTVPGELARAGYHTALIGKWHLQPDPWECGFAEVGMWLPGGSGPYQNPNLAHGRSRTLQPTPGHVTEIFANDAIAFLRRQAGSDRPFFLWLAFTAPHLPYGPNPPHITRLYAGKTAADLLPPGFPRDIPTGDWVRYYEAISHLDEQVGRVLAALDPSQRQNTVVVFIGDNGYMMGSHGIGARGGAGKVVPYDDSIRVPWIVRAPMLARAPRVSDAAVSGIDLPVTLLRLADLRPPETWPGRDLTPLLRGRGDRDVAFGEWADDQSAQFGRWAYRLVRTPHHKLIVFEDPMRVPELYDLAVDPRETRNRYAEPASASVRARLLSRLRRWLARTDDPAREWPAIRDELPG